MEDDLNISSNQVNNRLHTEKKSHSLFNSGDRYEEDLKIRIWKKTLQFKKKVLYISSSYVKIKLHAKNQLPMWPGSGLQVCVWADTRKALMGLDLIKLQVGAELDQKSKPPKT